MKTRTLRIIFALILALGILFSAIPAHAAASVDTAKTDLANACMLVDLTTGSVLYASENASLQIKPASTTKILTAAVIVDNCNLDDVVTCGPEVAINGSKFGLVEGEEMTVRELLYGMMLVSGNDCALALAKHASPDGTIPGFAQLMNDKAAAIGMTNSHFMTPHGMDDEEQYVTCEDMAKLIIYVYNNYPLVNQIASAKSHTFPENNKRGEMEKFTTNKLLYKRDNDAGDYTYQYTTGYKTGSTPYAGDCLVATAEKNGTQLAALVYGVPDEETDEKNRWNIAEYLFEYGFENFVTRDISSLTVGQTVSVSVNNAILPDKSKGIAEIIGRLNVPEGTIVTLDKSDAEGELQIDFQPTNGMLEAPIYEGDIVGKAKLRYGESVIYECDVTAAESALSTIEEYELAEGPVSEIEQVEVNPEEEVKLSKEEMGSLWWLLLIPAGAVIALIVVMILKNRKGSGLGHITRRERTQAAAPRSRYASANTRGRYAAPNTRRYPPSHRRR